jgi:hypothetical protein
LLLTVADSKMQDPTLPPKINKRILASEIGEKLEKGK